MDGAALVEWVGLALHVVVLFILVSSSERSGLVRALFGLFSLNALSMVLSLSGDAQDPWQRIVARAADVATGMALVLVGLAVAGIRIPRGVDVALLLLVASISAGILASGGEIPDARLGDALVYLGYATVVAATLVTWSTTRVEPVVRLLLVLAFLPRALEFAYFVLVNLQEGSLDALVALWRIPYLALVLGAVGVALARARGTERLALGIVIGLSLTTWLAGALEAPPRTAQRVSLSILRPVFVAAALVIATPTVERLTRNLTGPRSALAGSVAGAVVAVGLLPAEPAPALALALGGALAGYGVAAIARRVPTRSDRRRLTQPEGVLLALRAAHAEDLTGRSEAFGARTIANSIGVKPNHVWVLVQRANAQALRRGRGILVEQRPGSAERTLTGVRYVLTHEGSTRADEIARELGLEHVTREDLRSALAGGRASTDSGSTGTDP